MFPQLARLRCGFFFTQATIRRPFFDLLVHKIADVYLHHPAPKKNLNFIVFLLLPPNRQSCDLFILSHRATSVVFKPNKLTMDTLYRVSIKDISSGTLIQKAQVIKVPLQGNLGEF